jgi:hypothetical protein
MKYYLSDIIPRLKKYSATLDQSALLVDKPWVVSNNDERFEKLIFRRDGRVHLSSDGKVQDGKWEYLPEAKSLLIDYGDIKKLYRHQYLDQSVLALKQDGSQSEDDFFLLANENAIPDCNAKKYLRDKYLAKNNTEIKKLSDGKEIELAREQGSYRKKALFNGTPLQDGSYFLEGKKKKIVIKNGNVNNTIKKIDYSDNVSIWQRNFYPTKGDLIEGVENGKITVKRDDKFTLIVENERIKKVTNHIQRNLVISLLLFIISIVILVCILKLIYP